MIGLAGFLLTFSGLLFWSVTAPIASAAMAPGVLVVESNRKTVQHADGGLVRSVDVKDGDTVVAGQRLLTFESSRVDISLESLRTLMATNIATLCRLEAERAGLAEPSFDMSDITGVTLKDFPHILADHTRLFRARQAALSSSLTSFRADAQRAREAIIWLQRQVQARSEQLSITERDANIAIGLASVGAGTQRRVNDTRRSIAEAQLEVAGLNAKIADANSRIQRAELEERRAVNTFIESVERDMQSTLRERIDLREKLRIFEDQLRRLEIFAPASGQIVNLAIHNVGAFVPPGGRILEIVPQDEDLVVEAQVRPLDIERVRVGLPVEVKISGIDGSRMPLLIGKVVLVSADRLTEMTRNMPFFEVRVELDVQSRKLLSEKALRPGMAADVIIFTGESTVFDYFLGNLLHFLSSAFRE